MAIRPEDKYGTRAVPANADYPHGSAKNETVDGANDGTPYTADFRNDVWGFFQALLSEANVTPSGSPDTALVSQYLEAARKSINRIKWVGPAPLGSPLSLSPLGSVSLAALGPQRVAVVDDDADTLSAYDLLEGVWSLKGSAFTITGAQGSALAALNSTDVVYIDEANELLRLLRFDGANWSQVGNSLSVAGVTSPTLTALNSTDVVLTDSGLDVLQAYRFDGTDFAPLGNPLAITDTNSPLSPALTTLGPTTVCYVDAANDKFRRFEFDGTDWTELPGSTGVGGGFSTGSTLTALNDTDVLYTSQVDDIRVARFDGVSWSDVSVPYSLPSIGIAGLTMLNGVDFAFADSIGEELRAYRLGTTSGPGPYSVVTGAF